jgi:hypothetical protein
MHRRETVPRSSCIRKERSFINAQRDEEGVKE